MSAKFLILNISLYYYYLFFILIVLLVIINQLYFKFKSNTSIKDDLLWSILWIIFAVIFGLLLFYLLKNNVKYGLTIAKEACLQYFTGYILEKALSIDNMFVILMIFSYFKVQIEYQHKVLTYGLIFAFVLRLIFILVGVTLVSNFFWIVYILGIFLVYSGVSIIYKRNKSNDSENYLITKIAKFIPISQNCMQNKFFIKESGKIYGTNLLLSLVIIELSDIIFAVDSIGAILSISMDKFIIFTSNIFAILGLRSLYFLLSNMVPKYIYLKFAISIILIFVGIKTVLRDIIEIPILFSLFFILICFISSIVLSILRNKDNA